MMNLGVVLPEPGFLEGVRALAGMAFTLSSTSPFCARCLNA